MSRYPQQLITATQGVLEQITLCVIAQELANRDYIPEPLKADRTTDSITWNIKVDNKQNNYSFGLARLEIEVLLPSVYVEKNILIDNQLGGIDERIYSINPLNISDVSLPRKATYPIRSWKVGTLPAYLSQPNNSRNVLERRIVALALHLQAIYGWIAEWNANHSRHCELTYQRLEIISDLYPLPSIPQGSTIVQEIDKCNTKAVDLLIELNSILKLRADKQTRNEVQGFITGSVQNISDYEITSAEEEETIFGVENVSSSTDPLLNNTSYLSESLYGDLSPVNWSWDYSSNSPQQPNPNKPQEPQNTVPDC